MAKTERESKKQPSTPRDWWVRRSKPKLLTSRTPTTNIPKPASLKQYLSQKENFSIRASALMEHSFLSTKFQYALLNTKPKTALYRFLSKNFVQHSSVFISSVGFWLPKQIKHYVHIWYTMMYNIVPPNTSPISYPANNGSIHTLFQYIY